MTEELLRQAMARGYCTAENEKKELDATLIDAMIKEILSIPLESQVDVKIVEPACEHNFVIVHHTMTDDFFGTEYICKWETKRCRKCGISKRLDT